MGRRLQAQPPQARQFPRPRGRHVFDEPSAFADQEPRQTPQWRDTGRRDQADARPDAAGGVVSLPAHGPFQQRRPARRHGRLVWSGKVPFEIHEMRARPDGFELTFTEPVDPATAGDVKSYAMKCWTYYHHSTYGCKDVDPHALTIKSATVGEGGKSVRLVVDGLRATYVQELRLPGMRSRDGRPLLHPDAYYTLNRIPR